MVMKNKVNWNKKMKSVPGIAITLFFAFLFLFPLYIAVVTSFKTQMETANNVLALPKQLFWENYTEALRISKFGRAIWNSAYITILSVFFLVLFSAMGGYAIARNRNNRFLRILERVYLSSMMLPFQILMIPIYKIFKTLHLQNNLNGVVLVLIGTSLAYPTFLIAGFVKTVPRELEDAARIDGCGPYQLFFKIVFPLLSPIISTVTALQTMWIWNDFNTSLILLQKDSVRTLTVKQFYFFGQYAVDYNMAFAAAIISMIPILIFFCVAQRYLVAGISSGAVKG